MKIKYFTTLLYIAVLTSATSCKEDDSNKNETPIEKENTNQLENTKENVKNKTNPKNENISSKSASEFVNHFKDEESPALNPSVLINACIGGNGDQYFNEVSFSENNKIVAKGKGFSVTYDISDLNGSIEGDINTSQPSKEYKYRPSLPGNPGKLYQDKRINLEFRVGYRQASHLQMPIFRAFQGEERLWTLWGHPSESVKNKKLGADTRCYQAWAMPQGRIGVQCWTDGGNSVLAKDPRSLDSAGHKPSFTEGAFQTSPGGSASLYALINPADGGSVESGTFMASHVSPVIADDYGRVYIAQIGKSREKNVVPDNPFSQSENASSGITILDESMQKVIFNSRIGGDCSNSKEQNFSSIAVKDNILLLGGTTCDCSFAQKNSIDQNPGTGQNAWLVAIKLWE